MYRDDDLFRPQRAGQILHDRVERLRLDAEHDEVRSGGRFPVVADDANPVTCGEVLAAGCDRLAAGDLARVNQLPAQQDRHDGLRHHAAADECDSCVAQDVLHRTLHWWLLHRAPHAAAQVYNRLCLGRYPALKR